VSTAAAPAATGRDGRPAVRRRAAHDAVTSRLAPLVRTITRIVDVFPLPMRILIGLLLALTLALGLRTRVAAARARRLERQRAQLLEDVGLLQAALLPQAPERIGAVGTSAAYRPADGPGAGGDFYDLFALDDGRLAAVVGDVSGHGRAALPHTALVRFTLRAYLEAGLSPREAIKTAGAILGRQLGESFVTVVVATYQPGKRLFTYACAGHPPPVVLGSKPAEAITVCSAPPIGAGMPTGTRQTVVSVPARARVCLYTDGITEARLGGDLFGMDRLRNTLSELAPQDGAPELLDRVAEQVDRRPDDMAACLLSIEAPAASAAPAAPGALAVPAAPGALAANRDATAGGGQAPTVLVEQIELTREEAASDRAGRFLLACGVGRHEAAELLRAARAYAEQAGTVLLNVNLHDGRPEVALQADNVASLPIARARQDAAVGALR
jgi:serine phosphatase RsbU (regulator of sigma subunit)